MEITQDILRDHLAAQDMKITKIFSFQQLMAMTSRSVAPAVSQSPQAFPQRNQEEKTRIDYEYQDANFRHHKVARNLAEDTTFDSPDSQSYFKKYLDINHEDLMFREYTEQLQEQNQLFQDASDVSEANRATPNIADHTGMNTYNKSPTNHTFPTEYNHSTYANNDNNAYDNNNKTLLPYHNPYNKKLNNIYDDDIHNDNNDDDFENLYDIDEVFGSRKECIEGTNPGINVTSTYLSSLDRKTSDLPCQQEIVEKKDGGADQLNIADQKAQSTLLCQSQIDINNVPYCILPSVAVTGDQVVNSCFNPVSTAHTFHLKKSNGYPRKIFNPGILSFVTYNMIL
jgi:hypothetical protein